MSDELFIGALYNHNRFERLHFFSRRVCLI
jgi:hypothetical protein